jgi:transposase-like protein
MSILTIIQQFQDNDKAIAYLEQKRWGNKVICPYCDSDKTCKHQEKTKSRWQCWNCCKSFSVTVGTIFHHSHIPLNKWFMLIALMLSAKKGISAYQAARDLDMRRVTVWSMMHRIRKAMATDQAKLLKGIVEMDECYVGGKPRKEKKDDDYEPPKRGRGTKKEAVIRAVERDGEVKVKQVSKSQLNNKGLMKFIRNHICDKATLITDEYRAYNGMEAIIKHERINHTYEYVNGNIHTNTIESFWALLKRGIIGQFHKVSKHYLQNYLDEFEYRYNRRKQDNHQVFENLIRRMCFI